MVSIVAYTDGSCIFNGKRNAIGGYGVFFPNNEFESVSEPLTNDNGITVTNNRAELFAIITALKMVATKQQYNELTIYTDSKYCKIVAERHCAKPGPIKQELKNPDMLKVIQDLLHHECKDMKVTFAYVAAHRGTSVENDKADSLAVLGTAQAIVQKGLHEKLKMPKTNMTYNDGFVKKIKPKDKLTKFIFELLEA